MKKHLTVYWDPYCLTYWEAKISRISYYKTIIYLHNRQVLVGWWSFTVKGFWTLRDNIYDCMCCYAWGAGLDRSYTGSRVWIPLKAWMFVLVFLCGVVLCRWRPCDELITRQRSPTICLNSLGNQKIRGGKGPRLDCRSQWKKKKKKVLLQLLLW
jgi:hypothetical protein